MKVLMIILLAQVSFSSFAAELKINLVKLPNSYSRAACVEVRDLDDEGIKANIEIIVKKNSSEYIYKNMTVTAFGPEKVFCVDFSETELPLFSGGGIKANIRPVSDAKISDTSGNYIFDLDDSRYRPFLPLACSEEVVAFNKLHSVTAITSIKNIIFDDGHVVHRNNVERKIDGFDGIVTGDQVLIKSTEAIERVKSVFEKGSFLLLTGQIYQRHQLELIVCKTCK